MEKILNSGERAPFRGVLVTEPDYRAYVLAEQESKLLNAELMNLRASVDSFEDQSRDIEELKTERWAWLLFGVVSTMAIQGLVSRR